MVDGTAGLHAAVVAAADDAAFVHQHGANGNAAFREALAGLLDGGLQKGVLRHGGGLLAAAATGSSGRGRTLRLGLVRIDEACGGHFVSGDQARVAVFVDGADADHDVVDGKIGDVVLGDVTDVDFFLPDGRSGVADQDGVTGEIGLGVGHGPAHDGVVAVAAAEAGSTSAAAPAAC